MDARRTLVAVIAWTVLAVGAGPAAAGGAMWHLDDDFYVPGDTVRAQTPVWLRSPDNGRLEDGPYFAFVTAATRRFPPRRPSDPILEAPIHVEPRPDGVYGDASVEFTVPDVAPGRYWIFNCNDPCTTSLGDLMTTELNVAADESEARLLTITTKLEQRIRSLRHRIANRVLGNRPRTVSSRLDALSVEMEDLAAQVEAMRESAARAPAEGSERSSSLTPLIAFVIPAALLGVVLARRPRSSAEGSRPR